MRPLAIALLVLTVLDLGHTAAILSTTTPPPQKIQRQTVDKPPVATTTPSTPTPPSEDEDTHPLTEEEETPLLTDYEGQIALRYFKHLLSVLGTKQDAHTIADNAREEFTALNTDGRLGISIRLLFELRLEDLLISVHHYREMKKVIDILLEPDSSLSTKQAPLNTTY